MTDAPERIWIDVEHLDSQSKVLACNLGTAHKERALGTDVEYVRADLAGGWQPIATAPMDGTYVLVWRMMEPGRSENERIGTDRFLGVWRGSRGRMQPTHWMPLPAPPEDD